MSLWRALFLIIVTQLLMATTCVKQQGAYLATINLSSCPDHGYNLPNFSETEDLILTQDTHSNFQCRNFKPYTKMTKETLNNHSIQFLLRLKKEKSACSIEFMIPRYCGVNQKCDDDINLIQSYESYQNLQGLLYQFLFSDKSIKFIDETKYSKLDQDDYTKLCN